MSRQTLRPWLYDRLRVILVSVEPDALCGFCPHPRFACDLFLQILGEGCGDISREAL